MKRSKGLTQAQAKRLEAALLPGETVCWAGCEPRSHYIGKFLLRLAIFTLWTASAGWLAGRLILMNPQFVHNSLNGVLPVLAPLGLALAGAFLLGREIVQAVRGGPRVYAITRRRAVVINGGRQGRTWAYGPEALHCMQVRRRRGGGGDILFESGARWTADGLGRAMRERRTVGFFGVRDVDEVVGKLEQIEQTEINNDYWRYP